MITLTWHASKYKVHKLHQRYILSTGTVLKAICGKLLRDGVEHVWTLLSA